jgi:hypothetical protein
MMFSGTSGVDSQREKQQPMAVLVRTKRSARTIVTRRPNAWKYKYLRVQIPLCLYLNGIGKVIRISS